MEDTWGFGAVVNQAGTWGLGTAVDEAQNLGHVGTSSKGSGGAGTDADVRDALVDSKIVRRLASRLELRAMASCT